MTGFTNRNSTNPAMDVNAKREDDIRKIALRLIGEMAQSVGDNDKKFAIGYILGVYDLADKLTEKIENDN